MDEVKDLQVYEISFWLVSTLGEEKMAETRERFQTILANHGALVIKEAEPVLDDIAYPMDKTINNKRVWFTTGYFGWIKFDVEPSKISLITEEFGTIEEIIRMLVVKTVREDTMTRKKRASKGTSMSTPKLNEDSLNIVSERSDEKESEPEIDDVTLDEKIEDIVGDE